MQSLDLFPQIVRIVYVTKFELSSGLFSFNSFNYCNFNSIINFVSSTWKKFATVILLLEKSNVVIKRVCAMGRRMASKYNEKCIRKNLDILLS